MKLRDCVGPGDIVYLTSLCHPKSPTWVKLIGQEATVLCAECDKPIVNLRVTTMESAGRKTR